MTQDFGVLLQYSIRTYIYAHSFVVYEFGVLNLR